MENLIETAQNNLNELENFISAKTNEVESLPAKYQDLLPEPKAEKIKSDKAEILNSTQNYLNRKEKEALSGLTLINKEIAETIYPLRNSEKPAGESQFQSAMNLVNSKNEKLILNELRLAVASNSTVSNRTDFIFSIFEAVRQGDFNSSFKIKVGEMIQSLPEARKYFGYITASSKYDEMINQINFYKNQIANKTLNSKNYKVNRLVRSKAY